MAIKNAHQLTNQLSYSHIGQKKVGMIVLNTDFTCEADFYYLRQQHHIEFDAYVNRIAFENPISEKTLSDILYRLPQTVSAILPGTDLDAIVFNCTAASAILGQKKIAEIINRPSTPIITTASAAVAEIKVQGYQSVDVLCPYDKHISLCLANFFTANDIEVTSLSYMGIEDDRDIARVDANSIIESAKKSVSNKGDALFISCTNTNAVRIIDQLELAVGKPVLSSNLATFNQVKLALQKDLS